MQKGKSFELLRLLDSVELTEFGGFLKKYYSSHNRLRQVFRFIKAYHPSYDSPDLEKSHVIKKVFKKKPVKTKSLLNIYSKLAEALEEFLTWKEINQKSFTRDYLLLQAFKKRNADELFRQSVKGAKKNLEKSKDESGIDIAYLYKKTALHYLNYFHADSDRFLITEGGKEMQSLKNSLDKLTQITNLKYECESYNRKNIFNEPAPKTESIENAGLTNEFVLFEKLFANTLRLIKNGKKIDFKKTVKLLREAMDTVHKTELSIILNYLTNFAIRSINKGDLMYREYFELLVMGFEKQILIADGFISSSEFQNAVNLASFLGKYEWLNNFVAKCNKSLKAESKENVLKLSEAQIFFEKKKFDNVLTVLIGVRFENIYLLLRGRSLILRSYVSKNESPVLILPYCRSFKEQLKRNKSLNQNIKTGYLNFLATVIKMQSNRDKKDLLAFLNKFELLQFKSWLIEIINKRER